jgi:hypothetical protein
MRSDLLKAPAVRVVILGVVVAAAVVIAWGPPTGDESRRIFISGADLLQQRAAFVRTWQREPTAAELRGALEQHIRQEVLYREALARGYDRDDLVVRRAMQQKMEFLAASQAMQEPPSEEEIAAFFALRKERYRLPAVVSFEQVYLNPDRRGPSVEADADALLARLRVASPEVGAIESLGDAIMLDARYVDRTEQEVASTFGADFADALLTLPVGAWEGPVASGYGLHLVRLSERRDGRIPDWHEVAPRVINDMEFEARASARDQLYQEVAQNYEIVLDGQVRELLESGE